MTHLALYEVPNGQHSTMTLRLTEEDAELLYGDTAKKVGAVKDAQPQPVMRPSHAVEVDETGVPVPAPDSAPVTSGKTVPDKARTTRRTTTS